MDGKLTKDVICRKRRYLVIVYLEVHNTICHTTYKVVAVIIALMASHTNLVFVETRTTRSIQEILGQQLSLLVPRVG